MDEIERAKEILEQIIDDQSVPKNIREICSKAIARLDKDDEKIHIRIGATISILDELSQDPNLPFHIRTHVWEVASLLETASSSR